MTELQVSKIEGATQDYYVKVNCNHVKSQCIGFLDA